jgi:hypothetical protein
MGGEITMQLPALIEPLADRPGFIARVGEPFNLSAEADTVEEALRHLTNALNEKIARGARVVGVPLAFGSFLGKAGWLPDDELTQEWRKAIEDYRQQRDKEEKERILNEEPPDEIPS